MLQLIGLGKSSQQESNRESEPKPGKGNSRNIIGTFGLSQNPPPIPKKLPYNHKTAQQEEK